jgi:hypothetical protein
MNYVIGGAMFATLMMIGSYANGQTTELPPIPNDDWRLQSVMLGLIPRCKESPPAAGHVIGAKPDPCVNNAGNGAYFVSASKDYSLRCGSYNCGAMIRVYLKTKRIPNAIEGQ